MNRRILVAVVLIIGGALHHAAARADDCTPAICAGMSPVCWLTYEQIMVHKGGKMISSEARCKELAGDPKDFGGWLGVQGVTTEIAICACAAAYWSLDGPAQGLPDID